MHNFATTAAPITDLLAKEREFVWGPAHQTSFDKLIASLTSAPVLALPDFSRDFVVTTDASTVGIGGTLS